MTGVIKKLYKRIKFLINTPKRKKYTQQWIKFSEEMKYMDNEKY